MDSFRNSHLQAEGIQQVGEDPYEDLPSLGSVTCFYNEEDIVEKTLTNLDEAVENSDLYETAYAVDDGSEDSTAKIIEEFASESEKLEFIEMDENTGKFGAQKHCTDQMEEDYWLSIDADSYIQNPKSIDQAVLEFDSTDSAAAMTRMIPETAGDGVVANFYEKMQELEYTMRRGVDRITSNGENSRIVTASGTATLGKTEKIKDAMEEHSGNYAGDDRELTNILQMEMGENIEYLPALQINTIAPEKPKEHLKQRRTWAKGQINAVSEKPWSHIKSALSPSRYGAVLTADIGGTLLSPMLYEKAAEVAATGEVEAAATAYGTATLLTAGAYVNAAARGEALESENPKGKAKELATDSLGIMALPAYKSATIAYSIPGAFKDKYESELTGETLAENIEPQLEHESSETEIEVSSSKPVTAD